MTRPPARILAACLLVLALVVAACGPSTGEPSEPGTSSGPTPTASGATGEPTAPPSASDSPSTPAPSTPGPSDPGASDSPLPSATPSASVEPGSADACSGTDQNREFFAKAAAAVDWRVYCAVLPSGWFVEKGAYRLANGGKLEITYRGPADGRLSLAEGHFCADTSGCVPSGSDAGDAAFGDMDGTLVATDSGGWAIVVERGAAESWLLVATGLDEAATRAFGEALAPVDG